MRRGACALAAGALVLAVSGCTALDDALASVPIFSFMRESAALDPYEAPRDAPPNAVPFASPFDVQNAPPPPAANTDRALRAYAEQVTNPYAPTEEVLAAGDVLFHRHCAVCHGPGGAGNGPVVGPNRFPFAPSLLSDNAKSLPDGYIYGMIRVGRGLMPAYGGRIAEPERWYIVNYVRQLQAQSAAAQPAAGAP